MQTSLDQCLGREPVEVNIHQKHRQLAPRPSTSTMASRLSTSIVASRPSTSTVASRSSTSTVVLMPTTSTVALMPTTSTAGVATVANRASLPPFSHFHASKVPPKTPHVSLDSFIESRIQRAVKTINLCDPPAPPDPLPPNQLWSYSSRGAGSSHPRQPANNCRPIAPPATAGPSRQPSDGGGSQLKTIVLTLPEWIDDWKFAEETYIKNGLIPTYEEFLKKERPPVKKPKLVKKIRKNSTERSNIKKSNCKQQNININGDIGPSTSSKLQDDCFKNSNVKKDKYTDCPVSSFKLSESSTKTNLTGKNYDNDSKCTRNSVDVTINGESVLVNEKSKEKSSEVRSRESTTLIKSVHLTSERNIGDEDAVVKTSRPLPPPVAPDLTVSSHATVELTSSSSSQEKPPRGILKLKPISEMLERPHIESLKSLPVNSSTICTSLPDLSADSINSDKAVTARSDSCIPSSENKNNTLTCYSLNGDCGVLNKKEANNFLIEVNRSLKKPTVATLPSLDLMDSVKLKEAENALSVPDEEKRPKKKNNSVETANKFKEDKYGYLFDHEVFKKKQLHKLKVEKKFTKGDLKIKKRRKTKLNNDEEKSDLISCKKYKEHSKQTTSSVPSCSATVNSNDLVNSQPYLSIQLDRKNKENNNNFKKSDYDYSCTNKLNENKIPKKSSYKDLTNSDVTLRTVVNSIVKNRTPSNSDSKTVVHENIKVSARSVELKTCKELVKSPTVETCEEKRKTSVNISNGELSKNSSNINQSNSKGTNYIAYPNPNRNSENVVIIKKTFSTPSGNSSNEKKDDIISVKLTPSEKVLQTSDSKSDANPRNSIKNISPDGKRETIESHNLSNINTETIPEKHLKINGVEITPIFSKKDGPSGSLDKMNLDETIVTEIHISEITKISPKLNKINNDVNNTVLNEAKNNDIETPKNNIFVQHSAKKRKLEEFNMFENVNIDKKVQQKKRKTDKYFMRKYKIKKCSVKIKKLSDNEIPECYRQTKPLISEMEIDEKRDCEKENVNTDPIPQIDLTSSSDEVNPITSIHLKSIDTSLSPSRVQEVQLKYPFLKITSARKSTDRTECSSSANGGDITFVKKHNHVSSLIDLGDGKSTSVENNNNNIIVDKSKQMEKLLQNENVIKSPDYEEAERPWKITGAVSLSTPVKISFPKNSSPPTVNEQQVMLRSTNCDSQDKTIVSTVGRRPPVPSNSLSDPRLERPTYCGFPYELLGLSSSDRERHTRITATQRYLREAVVFKNTSFEGFNCRACPEGFDSFATWVLHVNSCNKNK